MNFDFGMGGTPISLRQKLRMQRERMQCASLWPVVLNVLNSYIFVTVWNQIDFQQEGSYASGFRRSANWNSVSSIRYFSRS